MPSALFSAFAALACSSVASAQQPRVLHEEPPLPEGWRALSRPTEDDLVTVRLSLRQRRVDALREVAAERVSDPQSASYGQYLTRSQLDEFVAPSPRDAAAVEGWLRREGVDFARPAPEVVEASLPVALAEKLLRTRFRSVVSPATGQRALRARDFTLPQEVHAAVAAVYGVHGLPLPPPTAVVDAPPGEPVNVTPQVIRSRYGLEGVNASGCQRNRQAVLALQGQTISQEDVDKFFSDYVPDSSSTTSKIYKYVGQNGTGVSGHEAALDIQYIMGVAPGVLTEFWYFGGSDFCTALKNWTGTILADDDPPLVHSASYAHKGDLSIVGCSTAVLQDVELDLMKLAARGITIIFASGDTGSGYSPSCGAAARAQDTAVLGAPDVNKSAPTPDVCCEIADSLNYTAWSWEPPDSTEPALPSSDSEAHSCSPLRGMAYEGTAMFSYAVAAASGEHLCCQVSWLAISRGADIRGFTFARHNGTSGNCTLFAEVVGLKPDPSSTSSAFAPQKMGRCLLHPLVGGRAPETAPKKGVVSGGPPAPRVWPSWPASSPWVTAVGSTRFVQQDASQPERATDKFGSGGGFSDVFPAFAAQASAVERYLKRAQILPPNGSFPPGGRATPDVSALGEGYQVVVSGEVKSMDGTSAATPTFAALVSLLNEARLSANKSPMGYLNPWLYANQDAFTDVTIGTNAIGRDSSSLPYGFSCAEGWDPVTGLGTPIFDKMRAAALAAHTYLI